MKLLTSVVAFLMISGCAVAGQPAEGRFLVIGTPVQYMVAPESATEADINLGSLPYYFRIGVEQVVTGSEDSDFPDELNLLLRLSDPQMVMKSQIAAVIDIEHGELRLIHWSLVGRIACIPKTIVVDSWRERSFESPYKHSKATLCIPVD